MHRSLLALAILLVACVSDPASELELAATTQDLTVTEITRDHIAGDVYHYGFVVRVGTGPNAQLHIHRVVRERAPWIPRHSTGAVMMLHGDFATFETNFAPDATGVAPWLAARGIDVWGVDRRWTQAPEVGAELSDFDAMGLDQELDDLRTSLAFARGIRLVTDASLERMTLIGFSRGGQLAYFYTSREATRPLPLRHVKGLVPLDVYASLAPEDEDIRQFYCNTAAGEYAALAAGEVDVPNSFQIETGRLALTAPDDQSPFFPPSFPVTNREWMLSFVGETYYYFPATPLYHLNAPVLDPETAFVIGLTQADETVVSTWLANAAPHQSLRESADTDALVCGDAPLPADVPLSRIRVPLFLLAAAGGYGDHSLHSTTQVSSTDVTTLVVRQLPVEREAEDFGHADLLFSPNAAALAWQPLLAWLQQH
jgi:pimeloyl-ACP methyl ester carboxylesterase